jgi:hypothetical protein
MKNAPERIEQLADRLMKCVLMYKESREDHFLRNMRALSDDIRAAGYHPYFISKGEILIISREPLLGGDPEKESFDA